MPPQRFRLAPMDGLNLGLTIFVSCIPLLILSPLPMLLAVAPAFLSSAIGGFAILVLGLFAGILLHARPRAFELSAEGLRIEWPVREELIPLAEIASLEQRFRLYVSRVDPIVLVQLHRGEPWLITPESPERFMERARALLGQG